MSSLDIFQNAATALINPLAFVGDIVKNLQKNAQSSLPLGEEGPKTAKGVDSDLYTNGGVARAQAARGTTAPTRTQPANAKAAAATPESIMTPPDENGVRTNVEINTLEELQKYHRLKRELDWQKQFDAKRKAGKDSMDKQAKSYNAAAKDVHNLTEKYKAKGMKPAEAHKKAVEDVRKKNGGVLPERVNTGTLQSSPSVDRAMQQARYGADSYRMDRDIMTYGPDAALLHNGGMIDSRLRPDAQGHFDPVLMDEAASLLRLQSPSGMSDAEANALLSSLPRLSNAQ